MADKEAWESACRPKVCLLARKRILARLVAQKLSLNWSPQQISGWLEREYPNDKSMWVSHETILPQSVHSGPAEPPRVEAISVGKATDVDRSAMRYRSASGPPR